MDRYDQYIYICIFKPGSRLIFKALRWSTGTSSDLAIDPSPIAYNHIVADLKAQRCQFSSHMVVCVPIGTLALSSHRSLSLCCRVTMVCFVRYHVVHGRSMTKVDLFSGACSGSISKSAAGDQRARHLFVAFKSLRLQKHMRLFCLAQLLGFWRRN